MKTELAIFSSKAYLPRAKVAADSVSKYHPEIVLNTITVDSENDTAKYIEGLAKLRLNWAKETLEAGADVAVIMGADCVLYGKLYPFLHCVYQHRSVALVPHVLDLPYRSQRQLYQTGHANADLIAFTPKAIPVIDWIMAQAVVNAPQDGVFYEQTWLSALPFVWSDTAICYHPGINFAYFNAHERPLTVDALSNYTIGPNRLLMAQFSGYEMGKPERMSRHYGGPNAEGALLKLYQDYDAAVRAQE